MTTKSIPDNPDLLIVLTVMNPRFVLLTQTDCIELEHNATLPGAVQEAWKKGYRVEFWLDKTGPIQAIPQSVRRE